MAPRNSGKDLPAVAGTVGPGDGCRYPIATAEDLASFSFVDDNAIELVKENLGSEGLSAGDFERLKFPGGGGLSWQVTDINGDKKPAETIDGIILMYKTQHVYWEKEFDGAGAPPDCQSRDLITGAGNPGGLCATCPLSQWESGKNGGKACKKIGALFVMKPGEMLPVLVPVPVKSVDIVKKFLLRLTSQGIKYSHALVKIGLASASNKKGIEYSQIKPMFVSGLPDAAKAQIDEYKKMFFGAMSVATITQDDVAAE